jgi:hypothetical protein
VCACVRACVCVCNEYTDFCKVETEFLNIISINKILLQEAITEINWTKYEYITTSYIVAFCCTLYILFFVCFFCLRAALRPEKYGKTPN